MKRLAALTEQYVKDLRALPQRESSSATRDGPVNCLIVEDDDNDAVLSMEAVGSVGGVTAMLAKSGEDALQLLQEAQQHFRPQFDIVFVDLKLQGSEAQGIDVIKRIRANFPDTHVIIVSGHLSSDILERLRGTYFGIVSKPLMADNLEEILSKHRMKD